MGSWISYRKSEGGGHLNGFVGGMDGYEHVEADGLGEFKMEGLLRLTLEGQVA